MEGLVRARLQAGRSSQPSRDAAPSHLRSAVSTFWMANPNNNLVNCAAAGSEVSRGSLFLQRVRVGLGDSSRG